MAYDEGLAERIRTLLVDEHNISEKKMFGGIAFMQNDYMFVGVTKDELMARVGPDNQATALAKPHVRPMDFTGKPMKGYIYVEPDGLADDKDLEEWVQLCARFVQILPPKQEKKK